MDQKKEEPNIHSSKESNLCLNSFYYKNKAIFEKEKKAIFEKEWQLLCLEAELPELGSFLVQEIVGKPVLVVKTKDGFFAYLNVCRHRGNSLVQEHQGKLKSSDFINCKYHAWTFKTKDGSLYTAPKFDETMISKKDLSLNSVRLETWLGIIFVNIDGNAPPLKEWLGDIPHLVEKYDMSRFDKYDLKNYPLKANWKAFIDGYQECYHCAIVHPNLRKIYNLERYIVENFQDSYSLHHCERKHEDGAEKIAEDLMGGNQNDLGVWIWKYPNITISCYPYGCFIMSADPLKTNQTNLRSYFRFTNSITQEQRKKFQEYIDTNVKEDANITEEIQKNIDCEAFIQGPLHPKRENGVIFFHSLVRKSLSSYHSTNVPLTPVEFEQTSCFLNSNKLDF